ncbi:PQQ-binding-like beta-propeller repeat protein, partial [Verrucomicrobia bacterium]|nr:PQQ-binding-like beta-propeller repeat protein [Verrucomicrobiota bacterium]
EAYYVTGGSEGAKTKKVTPAKIGDKDADIIWVYDMMDELGSFPHNAANSSPLVLGDLIYVCTSNGQDWTHVNIPSPLTPSFIALDKTTGELKGEDDAEIGENIFHGQWTSPSAGKVGEDWQVFFGGGNGIMYGFDAEPEFDKDEDLAFLRKLWWVDTNPKERFENDYPDPDGPNEVIATPVYYDGKVYVAHGQDPEHGEGVGLLFCIDPTKRGDITESGVIWKYEKINRSISTVSIDPVSGLLFVGDFSGFLHCLDAKTGEEVWIYDTKAHLWSSTLVADGRVYLGDEDGDFVVLPAKRDFDPKKDKPIFETNLQYPIYSTPIIANGVMYVGTAAHLYAIQDASKGGKSTDQPKAVEIK